MFTASYVWHGVILNDYERLSYPKEIFLSIASVVYLVIGAIVAHAYSGDYFKKIIKSPLLRGLITGGICGFTIYLVSLVVGITFSSSLSLKYIIVDLTWQAIEQGVGGFVVGYVHLISEHHPWFRTEQA